MVKRVGRRKRKDWRCQAEYVRKVGEGKLQNRRRSFCETSKAENQYVENVKVNQKFNMFLC